VYGGNVQIMVISGICKISESVYFAFETLTAPALIVVVIPVVTERNVFVGS
jgi:hypothetical protein